MTECRDYAEEQRIKEQLCKVDALIDVYNEALTSIAAGAMSYTLDTGQTRQTVTKTSAGELTRTLEALENRRNMLRSRLHGSGYYARPGW